MTSNAGNLSSFNLCSYVSCKEISKDFAAQTQASDTFPRPNNGLFR